MKKFEMPVMNVAELSVEDIIATSLCPNQTPEDDL